jgi:hypothetical protein
MTVAYNPSCVTNGLVLYLDAGNTKSYPGTGTAWTDLSGNANNGILVNSPVFSSNYGGILSFNGTNQYADCGYNSIIYNLTTNFTIEVWVMWTGAVATTGNGQWMVANVDVSGTIGGFQLGYIPSIGFILSTYGNIQDVRYNIVPTINTWYHFVGTKSSTLGYALYLNGVSVASNSILTAAGVAPSNLRIAQRQRDNTYFPGNIPLLRVYNRALSATEILQNFSALRGRFGL